MGLTKAGTHIAVLSALIFLFSAPRTLILVPAVFSLMLEWREGFSRWFLNLKGGITASLEPK
jgi:hypothetical protein